MNTYEKQRAAELDKENAWLRAQNLGLMQEIAQLKAELEAIGAGGVETLRKCLHQIAEPSVLASAISLAETDELASDWRNEAPKFAPVLRVQAAHIKDIEAKLVKEAARAAQKGKQ